MTRIAGRGPGGRDVPAGEAVPGRSEGAMTRSECTAAILAAKQAKGLTWQAIADAVGRHVVWATAALLGQATMDQSEAAKVADLLGLGPEVAKALQQFPTKGSLAVNPPTDPLIYRFYEIVQVYGTTLK